MTARTLEPAELEQLARALHRGDELTREERTLYHRADSDMTGETGGDLIEALDRLEDARSQREAEARATAADCDDASTDELEAAAEIYDRLTRFHRND